MDNVSAELLKFWQWWQPRRVFRPPFDDSVKTGGVYREGDVEMPRPSFGAVIFRQDAFQIEHLIYPPDTSVPEHLHPDVDSLGVYLSGDIEFTLFGRTVHGWDESTRTGRGWPSSLGRVVPIPHTVTHGVRIGPKGGSFLSVQHWLAGDPQRVSDNWRFKDHPHAH